MIARRRFLKGCLSLTAAAFIPPVRAEELACRRLSPVHVDPARVIRTIVGLRPYRPSGFVVTTQGVGAKTVVHNYGHGGAGITLSWGTSELAADLAMAGEGRDIAVLGCGVVGLSTGILLQRRGASVTIYARELPPHTTSNIAGGQWGPAMVADKASRTPAWNAQFARASSLSFRAYQDLAGDTYGVRWLENYILSSAAPEVAESDFPQAADVHVFDPQHSPFAGKYARRFQTMMIEPAVYLHRLMLDFVEMGGRIVVRNLPDLHALVELPQAVVVNCTGLGDRELTPGKGQLTVLLPQSEVDYAVISGGLYMFPRHDGVLLGGTHEHGNFSLDPDPKVEREILAGHASLFSALR